MNSHIFKLIENSIDAITQPDRWNDLTDLIVDSYALNSATIIAVPLNPMARPEPYYSRYLREEGHRIIKKFVGADDTGDMATYSKLAQMNGQTLYSEREIRGVEADCDLPYSSTLEIFLTESATKSRLVTKMNLTGPWMDVLALHAKVDSLHVPKEVFDEMRLLVPIFAKSLNTFRALEALKRHFGMRLRALDYLGFGAALVDETGMIAYSNSYAREVWAERDGIEKTPTGRIGIHDNNSAAEFSNILERACAPAANLRRTGALTLSVPRISGRASYFIKAHALTDGDNETDIRFPFSLVFLVDPERSGSLSCEGIENMQLLTPAETDICERLLAGAETVQIAEQRGVSLHTVRQQIKAILSKLQCRNRNELFHVALTSHLPVREFAGRTTVSTAPPVASGQLMNDGSPQNLE